MLRGISKKTDVEASKQALSAFEDALSEMGAEMHDDLIQRLSILRLHLDKLKSSLTDRDIAERVMDDLDVEFEGIAGSVRRISKRLRPAKIDGETFEEAIQTLCRIFDGPRSAHIEFIQDGIPQLLHPEHELFLLRMIQELIQNALRHSSAWHVWIRLNWSANNLKIEVEDDGTGFVNLNNAIDSLKKKNNTLRMRAIALGAEIKYTNGNAGLLAIITYPLKTTVFRF